MIIFRFLGFLGWGISLKLLVLNTQLLKIWNGAKRFCLVAILYMEDAILVNSATFTDGETWFELIGTIGTAGRRCSFMHAADGFAEATGTEFSSTKYYLLVWELSSGTTDRISSARQVGAPVTLQTI